jgi:hypothetical protein
MDDSNLIAKQTPCCAGSTNPDSGYDIRKNLREEKEHYERRIASLNKALAFLDANPGLSVAHDRLTTLINGR